MRRIFDSVHGFILLGEIECALLDLSVVQRLRYIRQLGATYFVYPGATHTRFEHSLGVMELATRMFDRLHAHEHSIIDIGDRMYARTIVRLAALCHDLGHLPFSHVAERALLGQLGHENWTLRIIVSAELAPIWQMVETKFPGMSVCDDVMKLAIGEKKLQELLGEEAPRCTGWEQALGQIIAGDVFGADRIDYLLRDARNTGVAYGVFDYHQLLETICLLPGVGTQTYAMGVGEEGIEACEALLLARHFMHRRVYNYPSVRSYSFHLSRFMQAQLQQELERWSLATYLSWTDNIVLTRLQAAITDVEAPGHEDALCMEDRTKRYRAISIPGRFTRRQGDALAEKVGLPPNAITVEEPPAPPSNVSTDFPVRRKQGHTVSASTCLQLPIPSNVSTWIYADPAAAERIEKAFPIE